MYGWIVDGISSLFEPLAGLIPVEERSTLHADSSPPQQRLDRPAKRHYQSVDAACVTQSDPIEPKRSRRDVVVSFVKKTVASVAGLLSRQRPQMSRYEKHRLFEDSQGVSLMGIDELQTSWRTTEWRMDKSRKERKSSLPSSSPPLVRRFSGTVPSAGLPDMERKGSLQLLPSRTSVKVGTQNADLPLALGHSRFYKPSLTVEEAIKQNNKEHYRRLLEMVTEKYSKSQPLPFNQTKPQELLSKGEHKKSSSGRACDSAQTWTGYSASSNVFAWRNPAATKERKEGLTLNKPFSTALEEADHVWRVKPTMAELDLSAEVASRLHLESKDPPGLLESTHTHLAHGRHGDEEIPRLTKEMAAQVSTSLAHKDPNLVLSSAFKLRITPRDLATLQEGGWLNDEVINFYFSLLMEQSSSRSAGPRVYSFSTFFLPKLQGGGHPAVKRWTKAVDLFLHDLILVPLHLGIHWALAVIDLKSKTVKSYDSMGQRHDEICALLLLYLQEELRIKKGRELDCVKWTVCSVRASEIPQQRNGSDCGVFACKYADYITKEKPFTFKQCHMPLFRKLMIWEILNRKLL
ncbi:sentrin-specific protease 2 isoform X2 [Synchiropus splendidus]|uniref:sentrin-specific protease 2 isoform X2 n=1 Tax=Synchiropus splendidus TaxID=270530 RepID=UPI00237EA68D|nr:sentrin-specific protease 2 isoform X2 [Synchiropus splendidus]